MFLMGKFKYWKKLICIFEIPMARIWLKTCFLVIMMKNACPNFSYH